MQNDNSAFIKVKFKYLDDYDQSEQIESMWVSISGEYYKIENIPFYVSGLALGDIISVEQIEDELYGKDLIEESGNSTIRIVFFNKTIVQKTRDELKHMGCDSELSNIPSLIALDVPATVNYNSVIRPYLEKGTNSGDWDYQEACLAQ